MSRAAELASGFQLPCMDYGEPVRTVPPGICQKPIRVHADSFGTKQPFVGNRSCHSTEKQK